MKAALRQLVQALPEPFRVDAGAAASAVIVDPARWGREAAPDPPHLDVLRQAVVRGEEVWLGYGDRDRNETSRLVHPLGLVTKGTVWYLIADTELGRRTFRVDRVRSAAPTGTTRPRPAGFVLAEEWERIAAEIDERRSPVQALVLVDPSVLGLLRSLLGRRVRVVTDPATDPVTDGATDGATEERVGRGDRRVAVEIRGNDPHVIAAELAGFGRSLEVVEPVEIRNEMVAVGRELLDLYATP